MLPDTISRLCSSYLHLYDLASLRQSCKYWNSVTQNPEAINTNNMAIMGNEIPEIMKYYPTTLIILDAGLDLNNISCDMKSIKSLATQTPMAGLTRLTGLELYCGPSSSDLGLMTLKNISLSYGPLYVFPQTLISLTIDFDTNFDQLVHVLKSSQVELLSLRVNTCTSAILQLTSLIDLDMRRYEGEKKFPSSLRTLRVHELPTYQLQYVKTLYIDALVSNLMSLSVIHFEPHIDVKMKLMLPDWPSDFPLVLLPSITKLHILSGRDIVLPPMPNLEQLNFGNPYQNSVKIYTHKSSFPRWPKLRLIDMGSSVAIHDIINHLHTGPKPVSPYPRITQRFHDKDYVITCMLSFRTRARKFAKDSFGVQS